MGVCRLSRFRMHTVSQTISSLQALDKLIRHCACSPHLGGEGTIEIRPLGTVCELPQLGRRLTVRFSILGATAGLTFQPQLLEAKVSWSRHEDMCHQSGPSRQPANKRIIMMRLNH